MCVDINRSIKLHLLEHLSEKSIDQMQFKVLHWSPWKQDENGEMVT